jgi:hypothetical protein
MREAELLRKTLRKGVGAQVRSQEERAVAKATALTWFNTHRPTIAAAVESVAVQDVDEFYRQLLAASDRATTRPTYDACLAAVRPRLSDLRSRHVASLTAPRHVAAIPDAPPSFGKLVGDARMQSALERRWLECNACLAAGAPLAATVMMGGLVEALLLARVNREPNKAPVFKATAAPKERASGQTLPLKEWTLKNYIDVAHELGWISQSAKDVGEVLRDYRNYVHPYKELSHGTVLTADDASLLWDVARSVARQLLK